MTARPPPPGMCTSTQHHVGLGLGDPGDGHVDVGGVADEVDEVLQLGSDAGEEQPVVVDEEHTRVTLTMSSGELHLDLGAVAGSSGDRHRSAVAVHALADRLGDALAVVGHGVDVEALAPVAHRRPDRGVVDLDEHRDTVGTPECLAALTIASRAAATSASTCGSSGWSPTATTSTSTSWRASTSAASARIAAASVVASPVPASVLVVEPGPQLPLLAAGQRQGLAGAVGVALDERQGLEHRVVQVGGHLRALLRPDALAALRRAARG